MLHVIEKGGAVIQVHSGLKAALPEGGQADRRAIVFLSPPGQAFF